MAEKGGENAFQLSPKHFSQSLKKPKRKLTFLSWEKILALHKEAGCGVAWEVVEGWRLPLLWPCQRPCRVESGA